MNALTDTLLKRRRELKLSLRKAAELIGISHSYLSNLEKGIDPRTNSPINPTPEILRLISKAYKLNYDELMYYAGYLNPNEEVAKLQDKFYSTEIKEQLKEFITKHKNTNNIPSALETKMSQYKKSNSELNEVAFINNFVEDTFSSADLKESSRILEELGFTNTKLRKIDGRLMYFYTEEEFKNNYRKERWKKENYPEVHDIEEAMKVILDQPGLMLKGELLSDESKIILANAIQMGLRTAEELEKKKSKGDINE